MAGNFPYEDIVDLPRPVSKKHPQPSLSDRAARFSPFAAITGYEEMVLEEARVTEEKIVLSEDEKAVLNEKLCRLKMYISESPFVSVSFFIPDGKKSGGRYVCFSGNVLSVDDRNRCLELTCGEKIPFDEIVNIEGELEFDLDDLYSRSADSEEI